MSRGRFFLMRLRPTDPHFFHSGSRRLRPPALPYVRVGLFDVDGVFRGKYIGRDKFASAIEKRLGFCDLVVGWDSNEQLYDNFRTRISACVEEA